MKKILLVDDDASIRFLVEKLLEKDFEVISVRDGYLALDWLNEGNIPDLILLDFEMPDINGDAIIKRVRFTPGLRLIPIIILSGNESEEMRYYIRKLGANDYVTKPFTRDNIIEKIERILGN
jgi:two-component system, chemotaxis family, chemotaxis protein CheY